MPLILNLLRHGLVLLALLSMLLPAARAAGSAVLGGPAPTAELWPLVTVLEEAGTRLAPEQALAAHDAFRHPAGPRFNLGPRSQPVWLRLPLRAEDDGHWMLQIGFAGLDRVDAWLVADGRIVAHAALGEHVPLAERPSVAPNPAWALALAPGVPHELLLRVDTRGPGLVPIQLLKPRDFQQQQGARSLWQGMLAGIGLCLVLYAFTQWIDTRDSMFPWYALASGAGTLFHLAFRGLGAQYLWGDDRWWNDHAPPLAALVGLGAALMLIDRLLDLRTLDRRASALARSAAAITFAMAALVVLRVLPVALVQAVSAVLVLVPTLVAVPAALLRWRGGDRAAPYMLFGWLAVAGGLLPMVLALRGHIAADSGAIEAAQLGRLLGMLMWLRVLGLRTAEVRRRAEHAEREHHELRALAHADALTGLPNRRGLDAALAAALREAREHQAVAVFVGDLDGFKAVNDRLGHEAGDELLVAAARRLRGRVRHGDIVARIGGDEFVVVATAIDSPRAAQQIGEQLVQAFAEPFVVMGQPVAVGLTLGFATAPRDGREPAELLRRADEAMYAGKRAGKGRLEQGAAALAG